MEPPGQKLIHLTEGGIVDYSDVAFMDLCHTFIKMQIYFSLLLMALVMTCLYVINIIQTSEHFSLYRGFELI